MKLKELNGAQKRRFYGTLCAYFAVGVVVLALFAHDMYKERAHARDRWGSYLHDSAEAIRVAEERSATATPVTVGTYLENLRELNFHNSSYRVEFRVWFDWQGDAALSPADHFHIYKGVINHKTLLSELHEGQQHYQLLSVDATISNDFETKRFPLESHQMRFYVESNRPIEEVVFTPDYENSGINRDLTITGYDFMRHDIGAVTYQYGSTHGNPALQGGMVTSEIVTAFEINRSSFGTYFKCFIALGGTVTWVLISLFICTYHRVDPLGMIPGALFGTVSNIMIGASLLPDALDIGLLEYVNIWGVLCILGGAIAIININHVRQKQENRAFATLYGRMLFAVMVLFSVGGQVLLPLVAYIRLSLG